MSEIRARLPKRMHDVLMARCARDDVTVGHVVRDALRAHLGMHKPADGHGQAEQPDPTVVAEKAS